MMLQLILLRIYSSNPGGFLVGLIIIGLVAAYHTYFSEEASIRRGIKKAKVSRIADVEAGQVVKISGAVFIAGRTIAAPLSGRECVYYEIKVEEKARKNAWRTRIEERKRGDVVLYDGSGYALIRDHKTQTIFIPDALFTSGTFDDALPEMEAFLNKHGTKSEGFLGFNRTLRYSEGILEEGEQCIAVGKAIWMKTSAMNLKLPVEKVLVLNSSPNVKCYISDDPELVSGG